MTETIPIPIDDALGRLREAVSHASTVLVCLDFDGTLAPIVDDPREAAPTPATAAALSALVSAPGVSTALVSGRSLYDVRERVDVETTVAGNHGLELERGDGIAVHPVARKRASLVDAACHALETVLAVIPNCRVENKRLTGTVHLRTVPSAVRDTARRLTRDVVDRVGGDALELSSGKCVLEISPSVDWGKGNAVELIASDLPDDTFVVYVGDDVTDESAFRAVEPEGLGVRVGDAEPSAATCRVRSPDEVSSLLHWLASEGDQRVHQPRGRPTMTPIARQQ